MKILKLLCITVLLAGCGEKNTPTETINQSISDLTDTYNKVWETLDMDSVAWYHTDDFHYWDAGKMVAGNNEEFVAVLNEILSTTGEWSMKVGPYSIQSTEDVAIVSFEVTDATLKLKDGSDYDYGLGAFTYVWKKEDGLWKVAHIHESHQKTEE